MRTLLKVLVGYSVILWCWIFIGRAKLHLAQLALYQPMKNKKLKLTHNFASKTKHNSQKFEDAKIRRFLLKTQINKRKIWKKRWNHGVHQTCRCIEIETKDFRSKKNIFFYRRGHCVPKTEQNINGAFWFQCRDWDW